MSHKSHTTVADRWNKNGIALPSFNSFHVNTLVGIFSNNVQSSRCYTQSEPPQGLTDLTVFCSYIVIFFLVLIKINNSISPTSSLLCQILQFELKILNWKYSHILYSQNIVIHNWMWQYKDFLYFQHIRHTKMQKCWL